MKPNLVKQKILRGDVSIGTFLLEFSTPGVGPIAAQAGADFALYDMEHSGWSIETIRMLVASTRSTAMEPFVRVPATEYHFIARVLDVGATGVMVPMVESAEQAAAIVSYSKYPPRGRRGAAFGVAHDHYSSGNIAEKMQHADREVLIIAQIETAAGIHAAGQIAAVDGIDVLWIGQFDLSNFLGIPGQFDHPRFHEAIDQLLAACAKHNKVPGYLVGDVDSGKRLIERGFRILAYGGDIWLYQAAVRAGVAALKEVGSRNRS